MRKTILKSTLLLITILFLVQCKKEPTAVNESELITRIDLLITDSLNSTSTNYKYCVNDAIFGNRKDTIHLIPDRLYGMQIHIFSSQNIEKVDTITLEIEEEADEHQFFITSNSITNFKYLDTDENGNPIGLISKFKTINTSTLYNDFRIRLIHEPNKNASGVKDGDITNAGGATDLDAIFKIRIISPTS